MKINRHIKNPLITPNDIIPSRSDMKVIGAFNCGVATYQNETLLLIRVAEKYQSPSEEIVGVPVYDDHEKSIIIKLFDRNDETIDFHDPRFVKTKDLLYLTSMSHLRLARSKDGIHFDIDAKPLMEPSATYEAFGIEDPRITLIDDVYYINYSAISSSGVVTCLATTKDFVKIEKKGIIFLADNKDVVIFPKKINGLYYAINRPVSAYFQRPEMWISTSKDLLFYGNHKLLCSLRAGYFDDARIGASCVPILTEKGWIEIYHGASKDNHYKVGILLLDKNDPTKILYRSELPLIEPEMPYEKEGFMPNVIFPCGFIVDDDTIKLYYGNCDENICLATFSLTELIKSMGI